MTGAIGRIKLGRLIWTLLVAFYFLVFFRNFFADAAPGRELLPVLLASLTVLWLSVEYYFGSPFFQSGLVEPSALLRGVFAFFVYPFFGYLAADAIWWRWTQIPVPTMALAPVGFIVFGVGTYVRLRTLFDMVRMNVPASGHKAQESGIPSLPTQRLCRHPRYLATILQMVGAALVFTSWGGLVLVLFPGLPLILLQARSEDRKLRRVLKQDARRYFEQVPFILPKWHTAE